MRFIIFPVFVSFFYFFSSKIPMFGYALFEHVCTKYKILQQYKIGLGKLPDQKLVEKSYKQVLFNHFVVQWIVLYLAYDLFFGVFKLSPLSSSWPSLLNIVFQFFFFMIMTDTALYWIHRR